VFHVVVVLEEHNDVLQTHDKHQQELEGIPAVLDRVGTRSGLCRAEDILHQQVQTMGDAAIEEFAWISFAESAPHTLVGRGVVCTTPDHIGGDVANHAQHV
jgi:hypothetical protein